MRLGDYDYPLPEAAIAQFPLEDRSSSRLYVVGAADPHHHVSDLPDLVRPGDVLVVNETKVLPARLRLRKGTGGAAEVLLLAPLTEGRWEALVRPGRRVPIGTTLYGDDGEPVVIVDDELGEGRRIVSAAGGVSLVEAAEARGVMPLPPYIDAQLEDPDRYQTVYARSVGSVAAPTAGLHFTEDLLARCEAAGAKVVRVDLRVGLGTFRPIMTDDVRAHHMHAEWYSVPTDTAAAVAEAERVIAVGTTTVRALESAATSGEHSGSTELFIYPGYRWKVVDVLFTNFHLPKSSLLVMLSAFMGSAWRSVYNDALGNGYRFLSLGDAMIVERQPGQEPARPDAHRAPAPDRRQ